jgi:hypothetical protein
MLNIGLLHRATSSAERTKGREVRAACSDATYRRVRLRLVAVLRDAPEDRWFAPSVRHERRE